MGKLFEKLKQNPVEYALFVGFCATAIAMIWDSASELSWRITQAKEWGSESPLVDFIALCACSIIVVLAAWHLASSRPRDIAPPASHSRK